MKRPLLHTLFWCCYFLQLLLIENLWSKAALPQLSQSDRFIGVLFAAALYMIPQVLFSYYVVYHAIAKMVKKKTHLAYSVIETLLVFFLCVTLDRIIGNYIVYPYVYHGLVKTSPLFDPMRFFFGTIYIGFAAGLMLTIKSVRSQLAAKEREKNLIKEKLETELKFLRNQTNPHFLLNTLNNIYALARKKSDDTAEVVMRLSELLRFMLYESGGKLITLAEEIKLLEDYLELEMIRYNDRLTISFNKETDDNTYRITPLLLLPFLENAFKHGISETRFESFINIDIKAKNGCLNFEIENTKDACDNGNSKFNIGLVNVQRQLELTYNDYKLNVQNGNDTFKVNLSINLDSYVEI